jgi:aspartokinase
LDVVASFGERLSALIVAAYVHRFRPRALPTPANS